MKGTYHLIVFMENRRGLGALRMALSKYTAQFVEGSEEAAVIERYGARRGLLLTFIDWHPERVLGPKKGHLERVELNEEICEMLEEIAFAVHDGLEVGIFAVGEPLQESQGVDLHELRAELVVGCPYRVTP